MSTILVKIGKRYYKARVNPAPTSALARDLDEYVRLTGAYQRQHKRGRLASMIRIDRRMRKLEAKIRAEHKNPLSTSTKRSAVSENIRWLHKHPGELTAKTKKMRHKQAIAIALSVWRRAQRKK